MGGKKRKEKQNKVILPPLLPPETTDDELHVSDEDIEFVKSNRSYAGFLKNLDTKSITRHVNRVADQKEDALELLYEKRNRKLSLQKQAEEEEAFKVDPVEALPVKTLDGQLYYRTVSGESNRSKKSSREAEADGVKDAGDDNDKDKSIVKLTKSEKRAKLKKSRKEAKKQAKEEVGTDQTPETLQTGVLDEVRKELSAEEAFTKKKAKLAEIGTSLLANPEANVKSLKELLELCEDEDRDIVKLGLLSMLAIFKDIIPGYRIRLPTEKELQMKVSKDVKKLRFYEATLLSSYKVYMQKLKVLQCQPYFKHVAIRCMCNLLDAVPHFNFHESLLAGVVKNINSDDDIIRKLCCTSLKSLFANEGKHGGEATVEAVRLIADLVKIHDCRLHPDCIEVLLSLSFDEDLRRRRSSEMEEKVKHKRKRRQQDDGGPQKMPFSDKKKSRQELMAKTREEVEADLKSVSFIPDQDERCKMQSETLSAVFEIYFRVLKYSMDPVNTRPKTGSDSLLDRLGPHPLLAPCLKGLGKFAHLIDIEFMGDLMNALKQLAGSSGDHGSASIDNCLTVSERLQCCIVAFRVMRNSLDALNIDLQDFFIQLYNLLMEHNPDRENQGEVMAEALKVMLCEGRQHDMQRAAAFIKRLATFCLCFGSAEAMAALVTLRHLLQMNIKCRNLLENDAGGGSLAGCVAKYQPDASDPNLSGALASVLWELSLLSKHYHPAISSVASSISTMSTAHNQVYNSAASPQQAFHELSIERESFNTSESKFASSNRKRKQGSGYSELLCGRFGSVENSIVEKDVEKKFSDHFVLLKDILENEMLRREIYMVRSQISLYDEYKKQKKDKSNHLERRRTKRLSRVICFSHLTKKFRGCNFCHYHSGIIIISWKTRIVYFI